MLVRLLKQSVLALACIAGLAATHAHAFADPSRVHAAAGRATHVDQQAPFVSPHHAVQLPSQFQRILQPQIEKLRQRALRSPKAGQALPELARPADTGLLATTFPGFTDTSTFVGGDLTDTASAPIALSMDVDHDGKPDLVAVQTDGVVSVSLNPGGHNGFSGWAVTSRNATALDSAVSYVSARSLDLNKDGYPDLVLADETNTAAFVYINKKDGTFADPVEYDFPFTSAYLSHFGGSIEAGDFNGDGKQDLAAVVFDFAIDRGGRFETIVDVMVAFGNGDGTFQTPLPEQDVTIVGGQAQPGYGNVRVADMNGDGKADLVIPYGEYDAYLEEATSVFVFTGKGDGTFTNFPSSFYLADGATTRSFDISNGSVVTDYNGDGKPDLVFAAGGQGIWVSLGNGDGSMQKPVQVLAQPGDFNTGARSR